MAGIRFKLLAGTALTLAGVAGASAAFADSTLGWYIAADAGQNHMSKQTLTISDVTLQSNQTASSTGSTTALTTGKYGLATDPDVTGHLRAGYRFTPNLRAEIEYGVRPGTVNQNIDGSRGTSLGSLDQTSLMANLIFDIMPDWKVHPFVGVGAGVVQVKGDYKQSSTNNGHTSAYTVKADATVPGAQVLAGASWQVTDRLSFDMTYRFLRTGDVTYTLAGTDQYVVTTGSNERRLGGALPKAATDISVTDTYGAKAAGHFSDQSLTVGLRWTFGAVVHRAAAPMPVDAPMPVAEPAAPQAAPATAPTAYAPPVPPAQTTPEPMAATAPETETNTAPPAADDSAPQATAATAHQYAVYFAFNSSQLNSANKAVVAEAAQYALSAPAPKVTVVGHTDTSGSAAYNAILSERRAKAVAAGLREQGVPVSAMIVGWKGESDLAVPTRNGVARRENRRTTIDVEF